MRAPKLVLALSALLVGPFAGCGPSQESESVSAAVSVSTVHPENAGRKKFLTVMTRNLYVGGDLFLPFKVPPEEALGAATQVLTDVVRSNVPGRAHAVAAEIAAARPDLVGLQEAFRIVVTPPGAEQPALVLDFIEELADGLADAGLPYTIAAVQKHLDLTVPLPGVGTVQIIDRDVILADADVEVLSSGGGDFLARFETTLAGVIPVRQLRGWTEAVVRHEQVDLTFVNAHLETKEFGPLQTIQAAELLQRFGNPERQLVLVGDMNSAPTDPGETAYQLFAAAFRDAWTPARDGEGLSCCFDADIAPPSRPLFERVDLVLTTDGIASKGSFQTGLEPLDALALPDGPPRWPSDHAGVVTILRLDE